MRPQLEPCKEPWNQPRLLAHCEAAGAESTLSSKVFLSGSRKAADQKGTVPNQHAEQAEP
jgi:hypothetical protein